MKSKPPARVALVHDWLTGMRGGEKVLEVLCELYPDATLFTLIHNHGSVSPLIEKMRIRTSFLQSAPFREERYRHYLPLFPLAIESFDFRGFDLIVSTSHAVAKGAKPAPGALHICYCHTPMRYVWELYDEYFGPGRAGLLTRLGMKLVAPSLRAWDVRTSSRVHYFLANSRNVAQRIRKTYRREADVIHAPVDTSKFSLSRGNKGFYLIVSALVPYKRVDLAIEVFNKIGRRLVVVGKGPDLAKLKARAGKTIEFLGWQSDEQLARLYGACRALVFPGIEDFGIVPLEAMASGKPVLAFKAGGALETVVEGVTGIFFDAQTPEALERAVNVAEATRFDPTRIRRHAMKFDRARFKKEIRDYISARFESYLP
jgi:glycosyltransferase involved in cell wall biosynthesis